MVFSTLDGQGNIHAYKLTAGCVMQHQLVRVVSFPALWTTCRLPSP
jgi:hypothetical protein